MKYLRVLRLPAIAAAMTIATCATAGATSWNERTVLRFSSPVMIPGATLQPGTYVFKLARSQSDRNIVQVFTADQSHLIAQTVTVTTKRQNPNGDVVFRVVDENGAAHTWQPDTKIQEEWNKWRNTASASVYADHTTGAEADNRAVAIQSVPRGQRVKVEDLEEHPDRYIGQTVTVDGEVQDVFGPRVFSIDEPNWGDLEGETLVVMPSDLAALVSEHDRVSVTGTVKRFAQADFQRELTWFEPTRPLTLAVGEKPVLVASRVVGGNDNRVLTIRIATPEKSAGGDVTAVGTSGRGDMNAATGTPSPAMTSIAAINGTEDIGRRVDVDRVTVAALAGDGGFWVRGGGDTAVLVVPAAGAHAHVKPGETVSLDGVVLQMPRGRRNTLAARGRMQQNVYLYAFRIGS